MKMKRKNLAPVALFVYNRPDHVEETIKHLVNNSLASETDLFIFSDAAKSDKDIKSVKKVRKVITKIKGFKKINIIERETNNGLAKSIITGVGEIIKEYKKVIVLEDDILTSESFLTFMNDCLDKYKDNFKIKSISGYNYPIKYPTQYKDDIYLSQRASSWGWATWENRWNEMRWDNEFYEKILNNKLVVSKIKKCCDDLYNMMLFQIDGRINSWAIKWVIMHIKNDQYSIFPSKSMGKNIGLDGSGVHKDSTDKFKIEPNILFSYNLPSNIKKIKNIIELQRKFLKYSLKDRLYFGLYQVTRKLKKIVWK